jgi:DNA-binding NarL/FixJ family response regulator
MGPRSRCSRHPPLNGSRIELASRGVAARVLVLTTYDTDSYVLPAIEASATGYLLKDAPRAELPRAVRAAARGEAVLAPSVAARGDGQVCEKPTGKRNRKNVPTAS